MGLRGDKSHTSSTLQQYVTRTLIIIHQDSNAHAYAYYGYACMTCVHTRYDTHTHDRQHVLRCVAINAQIASLDNKHSQFMAVTCCISGVLWCVYGCLIAHDQNRYRGKSGQLRLARAWLGLLQLAPLTQNISRQLWRARARLSQLELARASSSSVKRSKLINMIEIDKNNVTLMRD